MKKTIKLPSKPITKRDKHFYDMGATQQAQIFNSMTMNNTLKLSEEEWNSWGSYAGDVPQSRKELRDYKNLLDEVQENEEDNIYWKPALIVVVIVLCILIAHPYILSLANN